MIAKFFNNYQKWKRSINRCLYLLKLIELPFIFLKIGYILYNNTKYYSIYHIILQSKQQQKKSLSGNTTKPDKVHKSLNWSGAKWVYSCFQDQLNEFILSKRLQEITQHKYYRIRQIKDLQSINLE